MQRRKVKQLASPTSHTMPRARSTTNTPKEVGNTECKTLEFMKLYMVSKIKV